MVNPLPALGPLGAIMQPDQYVNGDQAERGGMMIKARLRFDPQTVHLRETRQGSLHHDQESGICGRPYKGSENRGYDWGYEAYKRGAAFIKSAIYGGIRSPSAPDLE
jgi:hypothetical protein